MRFSLRLKIALGFSALTIALLAAQTLGVRIFAERHEEHLISALISDDMDSVLQSYAAAPGTAPPFDARLHGYVSVPGKLPGALPDSLTRLPDGTHEIVLNGREIHVAIVPFRSSRLYRVYNFSAYETRFKKIVDALMVASGGFAILAVWLAFGLAGLLMRQVAALARQVSRLRGDGSAPIDPGRFDELELIALVDAFNDYHRRMADMIARERDFTGNVSHELRTPLTAIKTSCELLEQTAGLDVRSRERVAQIEQAADRMHEVVNALLLLAREDSPADAAPVRLASLVRDVLYQFEAVLAAKRIDTVIRIDEGLEVVVNQVALSIVLSNLIDNAARHTESGDLQLVWADGSIIIEDTGQGIAREALPHVFDRFYRDGTAGTAAQGFGIGLALVRKLCDHCHWPITIHSELTRGTRVSIGLKLG